MPKAAEEVIAEIFENPLTEEFREQSQFVLTGWLRYVEAYGEGNRNLNGAVFERLISYALQRAGIGPFFEQVEIAFVPGVKYDFVLFSEDGEVFSLSVKTSLRERYKQADLEALALKNIFRKKARSFLITRNKKEAMRRRKTIDRDFALEDVILADTGAFDALLKMLKLQKLCHPKPVDLIEKCISSPE